MSRPLRRVPTVPPPTDTSPPEIRLKRTNYCGLIDDRYLGLGIKLAGWNGQVAWHDFGAEATGASYGSEWDLSVAKKFGKRYDLLVKYADYAADELFTDTTKFWVQFAASF